MTHIKPYLILFDVDGTLLVTKGATSRCIRSACAEVLGEGFTWTKVTPGLLDRQIFEFLATQSGFSNAQQYHEQYRTCYLQKLKAELNQHQQDVTVLPGIGELLTDLQARQQQGQVVLGLLTGNYGEAVALKLQAAGIDQDIFPIHAFAEDGRQRSDLLSVALQRYEKLIGRKADCSRVIVIGDTPRDVACAHTQNCIAFAVATGWYSAQNLAQAGADHVVQDFTSPQLLMKLLYI